jgi:hypothetical protein
VSGASARTILRESFATYRRRFGRVAGCALALLVPLAVLDTAAVYAADRAFDDFGDVPEWILFFGLLTGFLSALGGVFYAGLIDRVVAADQHGRPEYSMREVIETLPYKRLIGADILLVVVTTIGLLLLVVPGVLAFTFFCLVGPLIVSEEIGIVAAFRRSAALVRKHFWMTLMLVSIPLALEHELVSAVEHMDFEHEFLVVVSFHAALAVTLIAFVALVEVTLTYELAGRHPPGS